MIIIRKTIKRLNIKTTKRLNINGSPKPNIEKCTADAYFFVEKRCGINVVTCNEHGIIS